MLGQVRWFDAKLGYGFIISPECKELLKLDGKPMDVFAHYTKVQMEGFRKLEEGEIVSYDLIWSSDGKPQAENIVKQK
jgi:cold shock protein